VALQPEIAVGIRMHRKKNSGIKTRFLKGVIQKASRPVSFNSPVNLGDGLPLTMKDE